MQSYIIKQKDFESAIADCETAIEQGYNGWFVYSLLGKAQATRGDLFAASAAYTETLRKLTNEMWSKDHDETYRHILEEDQVECEANLIILDYRIGLFDEVEALRRIGLVLGRCPSVLFGPDNWVGRLSVFLLTKDSVSLAYGFEAVQADPKRARLFGRAAISVMDQPPDPDRLVFIQAAAAYEAGDPMEAARIAGGWFLGGDPELDTLKQDAAGLPSWDTFGLPVHHPLAALSVAYYFCARGQILSAIDNYADFSGDRPLQAFAELLKVEVANRALAAIEELLREGQLEGAARLAAYLPGHADAGHWLQEIAEAQEVRDAAAAAETYLQAAGQFKEDGLDEQAATCRRQARRLRGQPEMEVTWQTGEPLVVSEWDMLTVAVANAGAGPAHNLKITVEGPVTTDNIPGIREIGAGESNTIELAIRPDNAGRAVPLTVKVSYEDCLGTQEVPPITKRVKVARVGELQ